MHVRSTLHNSLGGSRLRGVRLRITPQVKNPGFVCQVVISALIQTRSWCRHARLSRPGKRGTARAEAGAGNGLRRGRRARPHRRFSSSRLPRTTSAPDPGSLRRELPGLRGHACAIPQPPRGVALWHFQGTTK